MDDYIKNPFIPSHVSKTGYTLVLDLDETLIHYVDVRFKTNNKQSKGNEGNNFNT